MLSRRWCVLRRDARSALPLRSVTIRFTERLDPGPTRQALPSLIRGAKRNKNQGFNEAKSRHGLEHICRHHANSLLIGWLLALLALTIERLCRLRYLHRGKHQVPSSAQMMLHLWLSLSRRPRAANSS